NTRIAGPSANATPCRLNSMPHNRFRSGLLAAGLLALGGCAVLPPSRSASQLVEFSDLRQPDGQIRPCAAAEQPRALPAANGVVDSAALVARLASLPSGSAVYSVLFSGDSTVERSIRLYDGADDLSSGADAAVTELLRPQGARRERWGVQLRVTGGAAPAVRVGRQEYCPVLAYRPAPLTGRVSIITGEEGKNMFTDGEMAGFALRSSRIRVTARGEVVDASMHGTSAHRLTEFRFEPALIDRVPVDTIVEF
ncbi:hypothetical protein, partial [Longimicrobium sp.]|uniref:hypothetical protein n=1 Tax=Longimicrobium sp. TaxID=2029185 RepID=UPI002E34F232